MLGLVGLAGCTSAEPAYPPPSYPPTYVSAAYPSSNVEIYVSSEADFIEPLAPYGEWTVVASFGRCWRPRIAEVEWQPYTNGHWEWTDQGWYWVSDDPWGWATCHYGRWDRDEIGWYWVPQTQWSPAWVEWRQGDGYVGWAPLPPSGRSQPRPRAYVFVEERRFSEPIRPKTVIVNNTTIINRTVNITNTRVVNNVVINQGPRREEIEQRTGRRLAPVAVQQVRVREEAQVKNRPRSGTATRESRPNAARQPAGANWRQPEQASAPANQAVVTPEQRRTGQGYRQPEPPPATGPARSDSERLAAERAAQERRERDRVAAERAEQERVANERAAQERNARERALAVQKQRDEEAQRAAGERAAKEREQALAEQRQKQRDAQERAAAERERNERAVAEHAQRNQPQQQPASVVEHPSPQQAPRVSPNPRADEVRNPNANPHPKKKVKQPNENDRDDDKKRDQP